MDAITVMLERLRPTIERLGGGGHDGQDLYGDLALACVEKRHQYDWSHPSIEGRILRMAENLRITRLRRERVRRHAQLTADDCPALAREARPITGAEPRDLNRCSEAIDRLPRSYRQVAYEHVLKGKRLVAIANEMKRPSATIRTIWRRAKQRLACDPAIRAMDARGGGRGAGNGDTGQAGIPPEARAAREEEAPISSYEANGSRPPAPRPRGSRPQTETT